MFKWDDIQVFLAVADAATIRGAARQLQTTHATVSRRLSGLEDQLGSKLFERSSTKLRLTAVGMNIHKAALNAGDNMAEIDRLAFAQDMRLAGIVKLSVLESLYMSVLCQHLPAFQREYPLIEIELATSESLKNLAQREADIVIRITTTPPDHAHGKKLADSPLVCYASPQYLENRPTLDQWIALQHEPAKHPPVAARTVMTTNSLAVATEAIRHGQGIGMLPCFAASGDPRLVKVPEIALKPDMEIWALMHEDVKSNPRVRVLMDFIYDIFKKDKNRIEGK